MALNKDILGQALYDGREAFNDKTWDELLAIYGDEPGIRLAMAKQDAQAIIDHFTANGLISVNVATSGTAAAQTGTGTGTIS